MHRKHVALGGLGLVAVACNPKPAAPESVIPPPATIRTAKTPIQKVAPAPVVALVEPYLVAVQAPRFVAPPPTLRGNILPDLHDVPVLPPPPTTQTVPVEPSAPPSSKPAPAPTPRRSATLPAAVVKLFEDERARSVDDARRRLTAASTRATQTAAEAKRQWGFVKDGFVAQKQAEAADATAKDAADEQASAQKALDDAQNRQRSARRDVEAALRAVARTGGEGLQTPSLWGGVGMGVGWVGTRASRVDDPPGTGQLARIDVPAPTYQPMPGVYRLSVLGTGLVKISVQNGVLGRRLEPSPGEAGAWLVRCLDPAQLRVGVDARPASLLVRTLPALGVRSKV